jgi:hypothetical protein
MWMRIQDRMVRVLFGMRMGWSGLEFGVLVSSVLDLWVGASPSFRFVWQTVDLRDCIDIDFAFDFDE